MRRALLALVAALACALLCSTVLAAAPAPSSSSPPPRRHVLLIGIPLPGHVNPLLAQGMELRRRGWSVTIASPSRMRAHITRAADDANAETKEQRAVGTPGGTAAPANDLTPMEYMDLGDCSAIAELTEALERAADHENYMESAREMFHWALSLHHCMFSSLRAQIPKLALRPNIIVVDFASYAGFDAADFFGIPFVVNNPDLLNMLSPDDVAPYDFIPGTMTATSISAYNGSHSWYGLLARVVYPPLRIVLRYVAAVTAERALHVQQSLSGLPTTHLFSRLSSRLILVNNVFGLEYARSIPPNVVMVGPMLDKKWKHEVEQARAEYREELSAEDEAWLALPGASAGSPAPPVIWVSMGTIAPLNERQVRELYVAFDSGVRQGLFRVLWKLDSSDHGFLPPAEQLPPSSQMRVVTWISSQLGVLAHPATQLFISHCGINSVHESVYLEKKLLCIPILADQADMAARVFDSGVGVHLSKSTFTASLLLDSLSSLFAPANATRYATNLHRARAAMLLTGGVERAVTFIEFAASHSPAALVPVDVAHPWYVRHNLDVYLVWMMLMTGTFAFWRWICCTARPGKECVASRKEIRATSERAKATAAAAAGASAKGNGTKASTSGRPKDE